MASRTWFNFCDRNLESSWVKSCLEDSPTGSIAATAPHIFPSYVRLLHPARSVTGDEVKWSQLCEATGQRLGSYSQWDTLSNWTNWADGTDLEQVRSLISEAPTKGALDKSSAKALESTIGQVQDSTNHCMLGVWDGWGWLNPGGQNTEFSYGVNAKPTLHIFDRAFYLLRGTQDLLVSFGADLAHQPSANLFWPSDRSWFVSTDIDFDSTIVGGSVALCDALLHCNALETLRVDPDGSLALKRPI